MRSDKTDGEDYSPFGKDQTFHHYSTSKQFINHSVKLNPDQIRIILLAVFLSSPSITWSMINSQTTTKNNNMVCSIEIVKSLLYVYGENIAANISFKNKSLGSNFSLTRIKSRYFGYTSCNSLVVMLKYFPKCGLGLTLIPRRTWYRELK